MSEAFRTTRLRGIEARLVPYAWPWARDNARAIAAHWERRHAARPAMFDGVVLLSCACAVTDGIGRIDLFEARFSQLIAYREGGRFDGRVANAFAAIVPWSADGAVLVGEMGAHTANAGQLYFPCGTPDRDDLRGAAVDLTGSAEREFTEETGLRLPEGAAEDWTLLAGEGQLAFLRPVRFPETADALLARAEAHRRAEAEPELAGLRLLRQPADLDPVRLAGFARAYLTQTLVDIP
ncbi:NUDIX hydrolase [Methylobacterium sp. J-076]|uniref:NUDIX hydrolase n=1 Tax=Methylobacterium sp. J-076 TaxID=2836655 RepID=UPI001FBB58B6|nr:NUDIX hydrolase [Methylobacterium sp. J-076]MCJ2011483.1 NUDIX hydrolase [Methylobacterium sp. J-076]